MFRVNRSAETLAFRGEYPIDLEGLQRDEAMKSRSPALPPRMCACPRDACAKPANPGDSTLHGYNL